MTRVTRMVAVAGVALLTCPVPAFADDGLMAPPSYVHIGLSLLGLIAAAVLLIEALGVRKVALGGAIGDKISYVILAILCLAASAIVEWVSNFVPVVTVAIAQLSAQALVVVAMVLLAVYFYSVRAAMQRYLRAMTGQQRLAREKSDEWEAAQNEVAPGDESEGSPRA